MSCGYEPYTLPTIDFVGGETQGLSFNVYDENGEPFSLTNCSCNFSVVNFTNKLGSPILSKSMAATYNDAGTSDNVLTVSLLPAETVNLFGKYIYQIIIIDSAGNVEIPKQGLLYIANNINKNFIVQ